MAIRLAVMEDLPMLTKMARMMQDESPEYRGMVFDDDAFLRHLAHLGRVYVATSDGDVIGMMGGTISYPQFSTETVAYEDGLYVMPEYRGGSYAVKLVKAFEEWATNCGVKRIQVGTTVGVGADQTKALYEALGFHHTGYTLAKEIRT